MQALDGAPEWQTVRRWLQDSLDTMDVKLRRAAGDELFRLQGRAQCLEDLLTKFDDAQAIEARLNQTRA